MKNFQAGERNYYLTKRSRESLSKSDYSISRSPDKNNESETSSNTEIKWKNKPQIKFFEKFDQANNLLDESELHARKEKILKRVKNNESYRSNLHLDGYRSRKKVQILDVKNLKLQSITNIQLRVYNYLNFYHLKRKRDFKIDLYTFKFTQRIGQVSFAIILAIGTNLEAFDSRSTGCRLPERLPDSRQPWNQPPTPCPYCKYFNLTSVP
jgi:hypothetical protein